MKKIMSLLAVILLCSFTTTQISGYSNLIDFWGDSQVFIVHYADNSSQRMNGYPEQANNDPEFATIPAQYFSLETYNFVWLDIELGSGGNIVPITNSNNGSDTIEVGEIDGKEVVSIELLP